MRSTFVVLTLASLAVAPAHAALANAAPLSFRLESAAASSRGTPIDLLYTTFCSPAAGSYYTLRVTLAQRSGHQVTTGRAEASEPCSGRRQSLLLQAVPDTPGETFHPGRLSITSCLRARNLMPAETHRVALGTDDPACTGHPTVATVTLTDPEPLGTRPPRVRIR